jgi:molybdopterin molybdotransferase
MSTYHRTRHDAMDALVTLLVEERGQGRRVFAGFDFPFGYPAGFAAHVTGRADPFSLWEWLADAVIDLPDNTNNRFEVAAKLNRTCPGIGPFWGRPATEAANIPEKGSSRVDHGQTERRAVETKVPRAQPVWKLYTTGSVGSQALLGLPRLQALRLHFGAALAVWPFQAAEAPIVIAEIYPSLIDPVVKEQGDDAVKDDLQVRLLAGAFAKLQKDGGLGALFGLPDVADLAEEGWIFGAGHEMGLIRAARSQIMPDLKPPRLRNDCFALPAGVSWTPVDEALSLLKRNLSAVVGSEVIDTSTALHRVLASDALAARSNPPTANSAVDGYGFAHAATGAGTQILPLLQGRSAAGAPFQGAVPHGAAIRILTGAAIPAGVDTVVLQEDVTLAEAHIAFEGPVKAGANTRRAGEDVDKGGVILTAGHVLRPPDLALLSATGLARIRVHKPLRVGVLSTGDEIAPAGSTMDLARTYDANRPMLLAVAQGWGYAAVDLGHVVDNRDALRERLDQAAEQADVVLTSGGASAGDEDHVSALLTQAGTMQSWRIAVKPGRPLALGLWRGVPVFGLPGNPVAALVCTLIFARPALQVLAGAAWTQPTGFTVPAAFEKRKKAGRREFLRAKLNAKGHAEVFKSEGSGRISGLSWATGLVELEDGARDIAFGDPVRFIPYGSFGI